MEGAPRIFSENQKKHGCVPASIGFFGIQVNMFLLVYRIYLASLKDL